MGYEALFNQTSNGQANVAIGYFAATNVILGSNNIYIGQSGAGLGDTTNQIRIGQSQTACYIAGAVVGSGGLGSTCTNQGPTAWLGTTGVTNLGATNILRVFGFYGTTCTFSNSVSQVSFTYHVPTNTPGVYFELGCNDMVFGSSCGADGIMFK